MKKLPQVFGRDMLTIGSIVRLLSWMKQGLTGRALNSPRLLRRENDAGARGLDVTLGLIAVLFVVAIGLAISRNGSAVKGPFIFGDEYSYFQMARLLSQGFGFGEHTQYGPLYPFLIAPFHFLSNIKSTYGWTRAFNLVAFLSIAIPTYLLAKTLFPRSIMRFVAPVFVTFMPFSGFVYMVWAEPVYYPLFAWLVYLMHRHFTGCRLWLSVAAGLVLGLLFLLKPIGIVPAIAAALTLLLASLMQQSAIRTLWNRNNLLLLAAALTLILPWMFRNALANPGGPLGYPRSWHQLSTGIGQSGLPKVFIESFLSLFYQASYVVFGSFGLIVVLLAAPWLAWKRLGPEMRLSIVFLCLILAGVAVISAVHMTAYGIYFAGNGRYFCAVFPFIFLYGAYILSGQTAWNRQALGAVIGLALASTVLVAAASPIVMRNPSSLVNNPELSFLIALLDGGQIVWRDWYSPELAERVVFAICLLLIMLWLVAAGSRRQLRPLAVITVLSLGAFMSYTQHYYVGILGQTQNGLNGMVLKVLGAQRIGKSVAYDYPLSNRDLSNVPFLHEFWTGKVPAFVEPSRLPGGRHFLASAAQSKPTPITTPLPVPVNREAMRFAPPRLDGFRDPAGVESTLCTPPRGVIHGASPQQLAVTLAPGEYWIMVSVDLAGCPLQATAFSITATGETVGITASGPGPRHAKLHINHGGGALDIAFIPEANRSWAFSAIDLVSVGASPSPHPDLLVSARELSLPIEWRSSDNVRLYRVPSGLWPQNSPQKE